MRNLPVLASGTKKVAAQASNGKPLTAWIKMKKRLDFDG
jgi:hypothetical protein